MQLNFGICSSRLIGTELQKCLKRGRTTSKLNHIELVGSLELVLRTCLRLNASVKVMGKTYWNAI